jgi:hypothetical protein
MVAFGNDDVGAQKDSAVDGSAMMDDHDQRDLGQYSL